MTSEDNEVPQSLSKNMRVFLLLATIIIIIITLVLMLKKPPEITQATIQQEIQLIQQQLPVKIDPSTELKNVEVGAMQIQYSFVVVDDPTKLLAGLSIKDDNFAQEIETAVKKSACLNKNTRRYINSDVSLAYRYLSKDNVSVADFIIPAGFCNK